MSIKSFLAGILGKDKETNSVPPEKPETEGRPSDAASLSSADQVVEPDAMRCADESGTPGDNVTEELQGAPYACRTELDAAHQKLSIVRQELEELRKEHAAALESLEVLQQEHSELERLRTDYAISTGQLQSLQADFVKVRLEKDDLQKKMDETVARNRLFENTLVDEAREMDALREMIREVTCESEEKDHILQRVSGLYNALETKVDKLGKIIDCLREENRKLNEQHKLSRQREWSAKSEKFTGEVYLDEDAPGEEVIEEWIEIVDQDGSVTRKPAPDKKAKEPAGENDGKAGSGAKTGKGKSGRKGGYHGRKKAYFDLPVKHVYEADYLGLDEEYGAGNYAVKDWSTSYRIVYQRPSVYREEVHRPIIQLRDTMEMVRIPNANPVLARSIVSPELFAAMVDAKFVNAVTLYRFEKELARLDCPITRHQMAAWIVLYGGSYFKPLIEEMTADLMQQLIHHVDETTVRVIKDGRAVGSESFVWVHRSSRYAEEEKIVLFCYEMTRSTDHLRKFYEDFVGTLVSDCYQSYPLLSKESDKGDGSGPSIKIAYCNDHMRRPFTKALNLVEDSGMEKELVKGTLEYYLVKKIGEMYHAYEPLVELSPDERKKGCDQKVRPIREKLYEVLESLDVDAMRTPEETDYVSLLDEHDELKKPDPNMRHPVVWKGGKNPLRKDLYLGVYPMSDTLKTAIGYATDPDHKRGLGLFLDDPFIPISNCMAEQAVKPYAIGRKNWLFNITPRGAEAACNVYSLVQTCLINGRDPYLYMIYLMEKHLPNMERVVMRDEAGNTWIEYRVKKVSLLHDMMPYSEAYGKWEDEYKRRMKETPVPGSQTVPPVHPVCMAG